MKKVLIGLVVLMWAGIASAEIPLTAGAGFSFKDNKVIHIETAEILKWKGLSLSAGYGGDADSVDHRIIASVNYDVLSLTKYVEWPISKYVTFKPGLFIGFGSINSHRIMESELDYGASITVLSFRF